MPLTNGMLPSGWDSATVGATVFFTIAIAATVVRLCYRFKRQQLYWDDFWAAVALLTAIITMVVMIVQSLVPLSSMSPRSKSFMIWINFFTHPIEIWTSRLSIAVTIVRILAPGPKRTIAKVACIIMGLMGIAVILQKIWMAGTAAPFIPRAPFTPLTPILSLVLNIISDAFLVTWPALMLIRMKLSQTHTWLVIACFSTSFLVMVVDIIHSVHFIEGDLAAAGLAAYLLIALSLLLCNTTVLVTYIYRHLRPDVGFGGRGIRKARASHPSFSTTSPRFETTQERSVPNPSLKVDTTAISRTTEVDIYPDDDERSEKTRNSDKMQDLSSSLPDTELGLRDSYPPQNFSK